MPITVTHAKSNPLADWSGVATVNNSTGGTNTIQGSDLVRPVDWNSAHQITLALTGSEIASLFNFGTGLSSSSNASGVSVGINTVDLFEPFSLLNTNSTMVAFPAGTWYVEPVMLTKGLGKGMLRFLQTYGSSMFLHGVVGSAASTGQATKTALLMERFALYTRGTGTNSTQIEKAWEGQADISATQSITFSSTATNDVRVTNALTVGVINKIDHDGASSSTTVSTSGSGLVAASTMASTAPNSLITGGSPFQYLTGSYMLMVPMTTTLPAGQYWLAHMHSISSGGGTTGGGNYLAGTAFNSSRGRMAILDPVLTAFRQFGSTGTTGNSSSLVVPFKGHFASTTSIAPSAMATTDLRASTGRVYFNYMRTDIT
jgi:hypothetical protein